MRDLLECSDCLLLWIIRLLVRDHGVTLLANTVLLERLEVRGVSILPRLLTRRKYHLSFVNSVIDRLSFESYLQSIKNNE